MPTENILLFNLGYTNRILIELEIGSIQVVFREIATLYIFAKMNITIDRNKKLMPCRKTKIS